MIAGCEIVETLHESQSILVCRARRSDDLTPIIVKFLKPESATADSVSGLRREFHVLRRLDLPGVVKAFALQEQDGGLAMVLEDIGGSALADVPNPVPLAQLLRMAVSVADALAGIHERRIIHKNVTPSNIVWNPRTMELRLIDFRLSDELPRSSVALQPPRALQGTLEYMSPEQTGRMNRPVDYRTDFYSLGVTLYRVLTQRLPFEANDALELVHCHIAKTAPSAHEVNPTVPEAVSRIVAKLMAKTAEDRYQSAWGLRADLARCLQHLTETGGIPLFELGEEDYSDGFRILPKLYGRARETEQLLAAFDRVTGGARELVLLAGHAGVGKTALVHEIHKPVTAKRGFFVEGKFDQLRRDIPYSAWIQAFTGLVKYLLTESESRLATWRDAILRAVGNKGEVLTAVIPDLQLVIGPQPPAPALRAAETQNRFNYVFESFVASLSSNPHPLVVFLDDLQWIDAASLSLLKVLSRSPNITCLLILGAYRDNEVDSLHPLARCLAALEQEGTPLHRVPVGPLSETDVGELVADAVQRAPSDARTLSELVYSKTAGNAFFTHQMLLALAEKHAIAFDPTDRRWTWDVSATASAAIPDNVVDLMVDRVRKLPPPAVHVLTRSACVGNTFELATLAVIARRPTAEVAEALQPVLEAGLIVCTDRGYRFVHDRVQQAVYSLVPESERPSLHLEIGNLLLDRASEQELEENLFSIVDHLDIGAALIEGGAERRSLARLNLRAGRKAKASAAFGTAATYLSFGIGLLPDESWETEYELTLALHSVAIETAGLCGDSDRLDRLFSAMSQHARCPADLAVAYEAKIYIDMSQGELQEALRVAQEILQKLGFDLPSHPTDDEVRRALHEAKNSYAGLSIEALAELPAMTDWPKLAGMSVATRVSAAAFAGRPAFYLVMILNQVAMSIRHGSAVESPYVYGCFALALCGLEKDFEAGFRFGKLAVSLLETSNDVKYRSKTHQVVNSHVWFVKEHLRTTLPRLEMGYRCGLESGDLEYAGYNAYFYSSHAYFAGTELVQLEKEMASYHAAMQRIRAETGIRLQGSFWQAVLNLLGRSDDPCRLVGAGFDQDAMLPLLEQTNNTTALASLHINAMILCYLFERDEDAVRFAETAEAYQAGILAAFAVPVLAFYGSLARLRVYPRRSPEQQAAILEKVADNQRELMRYAEHAPMNFLNKYQLVEAERLRVTGADMSALGCYEQAASFARENEYVQEEGLAHELWARLWLARGMDGLASHFMAKARQCYARWGASRKVRDLEERYPRLLLPRSEENRQAIPSEVLDLSAVIKGSQAISGQVVTEHLLTTLLRVVVEHAGAERVVLFLARDGRLYIEAEGSIDESSASVLKAEPVDGRTDIPHAVVNYVHRTGVAVVLDHAAEKGEFTADPYIVRRRAKSILCAPIKRQHSVMGVVYLENDMATSVFAPERLKTLEILCAQAAISIENAALYADLKRTINELRRKEEALREREEQMRRLVQTSPVAMIITDAEQRITLANRKFTEIFGYTVEDVPTVEHLWPLAYPDEACRGQRKAAWTELVAAARRDRRDVQPMEATVTCKDGTSRYIEVRMSSIGEKDFIVFSDMTERQRVQETLRANAERSGALLRLNQMMGASCLEIMKVGIDEAVRLTRSAIGHLVLLSGDGATTSLEVCANGVCAGAGPEGGGVARADAGPSIIADSLRQRAPIVMNGPRDGILRHMSVPILRGERIVLVVAVGDKASDYGQNDVEQLTLLMEGMWRLIERKQEEEERKKLQEQLVHARKMEAIGTLAGGIAHDFNNILCGILGYAELCKESALHPSHSPLDPSMVVDNMDQVIAAAGRARDLVRQILTFSRKTESRRVPVELSSVVKEVVKFMQASLPKTIEIRQDIAAERDRVLADSTQMHQVLMNLCTNAGQAMRQTGGILEISLRDASCGAMGAPSLGEGRCLELAVRDTGHGIPADNLERIFEPYFTTKQKGGGSGMGLAVVHGIVKDHGGEIRVSSEPGSGSIFRVFLPILDEPEKIDSDPEELVVSGRGERILFVDDESAVADVSRKMLQGLGYRVVAETDPVCAIEHFRGDPGGFDLVITDKTMPRMTGFDVVREIRAIREGVPIVLCSGYQELADVDTTRALKIDRLVAKPVRRATMARVVREVLAKAESDATCEPKP